MKLSNPRRIKSLGDGIDSNDSWNKRRMMVLYDGVKAKFDQNWALQQKLTATKGKYLYEATTDTYFGCGIGYESKRWLQKDWPGENVSGLIVKKVRDEILGIKPGESDNTLIEIASQQNVSLAEEMETEKASAGNSEIIISEDHDGSASTYPTEQGDVRRSSLYMME